MGGVEMCPAGLVIAGGVRILMLRFWTARAFGCGNREVEEWEGMCICIALVLSFFFFPLRIFSDRDSELVLAQGQPGLEH
jgi:hypothetical protein